MKQPTIFTSPSPSSSRTVTLLPWLQSKTLAWLMRRIAVLILVLVVFALSFTHYVQPAKAVLSNGYPEKLAIFYGIPASVNGANGNITLAASTFNAYDLVVFGEGLEQETHVKHDSTLQVMQAIQPATKIFGYIDLCVQNPQSSLYRCSNFPMSELQSRTLKWKNMGAKGIFLDQAGCDYVVSRDRQNQIIDYIHAQGLSAFINVWNQDHAFYPGSIPSPYAGYANCNPSNLPTHLGANDYTLLESWAVILSDWSENYAPDPNMLYPRGDKALQYKNQYGTKVATVNTVGYDNPPFDQNKFEYVWWTSLLYGFDAMAWGETWVFSSDTQNLPFHTRPNPGSIGNALSPLSVTHTANIHKRTTSTGYIQVDGTAHTGQFVASSGSGSNSVTQTGSATTDLISGNAVFNSTTVTFTVTSNGAAISSYRIFIDRDNNAATGNNTGGNSSVGSDYMVENGTLYQFTGASQSVWSWSSLGTVSASGVGTSTITVPLTLTQISYVSGSTMKVAAAHLTASWTNYDVLRRANAVWSISNQQSTAPTNTPTSTPTKTNTPAPTAQVPTNTPAPTVPPSGNSVTQTGSATTDLISGNAVFNSTTVTFTVTSNGAAINSYRLFIDWDNNAATGNNTGGNSSVGSDYMVENGTLYQFTGASQSVWSWSSLGTVSASGVGTSTITVPLTLTQISYVSGSTMKVAAAHLTASWTNYDVLRRANAVWSIQPPTSANAVSQSGSATTDLISGNAVFNSTTVTFTVTSNGAAITAYRIFIDRDNNAATGNNTGGNTSVGADYMVENGTLYQFSGTSQSAWTWTSLGAVSAGGVGTSTITVPVTLSQISYVMGSSMKIAAAHLTPTWANYDVLRRANAVWSIQ